LFIFSILVWDELVQFRKVRSIKRLVLVGVQAELACMGINSEPSTYVEYTGADTKMKGKMKYRIKKRRLC
jgi:hypothetical protein